MQISLGAALIAARSFAAPETGQAYERAWQLCREVGDGPQQMQALFGAGSSGRPRRARAMPGSGGRHAGLAEARNDAGLMLVACRALANTEFFAGDLAAARRHAEQALAACEPRRHGGLADSTAPIPTSSAPIPGPLSLLRLGYPEQGREARQAGAGPGRELACGHARQRRAPRLPVSPARSQSAGGARAERVRSPSRPSTACRSGRRWARSSMAGRARDRAVSRWGSPSCRAGSPPIQRPAAGSTSHTLTRLRTSTARPASSAAGLAALAEAHRVIGATGFAGFEAQVHRIEAQLLLAGPAPEPDAAERCLRRAMTVARGQGARLSGCAPRSSWAGCGAIRAAGPGLRSGRAALHLVQRGPRQRRPAGGGDAARPAGLTDQAGTAHRLGLSRTPAGGRRRRRYSVRFDGRDQRDRDHVEPPVVGDRSGRPR